MTKPWTAEREVSVVEAQTLIESQFPKLAPTRIEPFGVGFDNTAYLVNTQFVFRFPHRKLGAVCMDVELSVLPHITTRLPLPVPDPIFVGQPTNDYPWSFAGYRLLPGRTACTARLDDQQRINLAKPLAHFLASLHRVSAEQAYEWGARSDTLGRLDAKKRVPMARTYLDRVHQLGLISDVRPLVTVVDDMARRHSYLEEASAGEGQGYALVLLHGDLYSRHLLVDDSGNLCGVIDWGDIHVGRIAVDLAIAHSFLPPEAHDIFRNYYGTISEEDWRMARFRAMYHSLVVTAYGYDIADEHLLREGLMALRYLA